MQQTVLAYGMDGFACLPGKRGAAFLYDYCARTPHAGFTLLPEIAGANASFGLTNNPRFDGIILPALQSPHALRIAGKLVVSSYGGDALKPGQWKQVFDAYRQQHGDRFLFLPQIGAPGGRGWNKWQADYQAGRITTQAVETVMAHFRDYLRATDGLYLPATAMFGAGERRFDAAFYRDFVIGLGQRVLAEPEFKDKLFALTGRVGKENCARVGFTLSSYGTETLRLSMEAALAARPDLIIIPEWDEQNENTSLRPTLCNSHAYMRIMRHYAGQARGKPLGPLPGDDPSLPGLIVSYRKTLVLGERLNVELLNVPDSPEPDFYTVRFSLRDLDGREVYVHPDVPFTGSRMEEHRIILPSENYASHQALLPAVTVKRGGRVRSFGDGLHAIELRGTWNWDYKWVMQPLRDLLAPDRATLRFDGMTNGVATFSAEVDADEDLAYVELLDHNATVFTALNPGETPWRETADQTVLAIDIQNLFGHSVTLNGAIRLAGVDARWLRDTTTGWPTTYPKAVAGDAYPFHSVTQGLEAQTLFVAFPAAAAGSAELTIDLPGAFVDRVPVRRILETGVYGVPGEGVATMAVSRFMRQAFHPFRLNSRQVRFTAGILPDLPHSLVHLQVIAASGRIWRSRPIPVNPGQDAASRALTVFSDSRNAPVTVQAPTFQAPGIAYTADARDGTALRCDAGRMFWGIGGGYPAQVTFRGRSRSRDTSAFNQPGSYPADAVRSAPAIETEIEGGTAWRFDGRGTHLALPSGVIPRRAAFTLSMELNPTDVTGEQIILANRSHTPGTLTLMLADGVLKGTYLGDGARWLPLDIGLKVPADRWSTLRIDYDLAAITFTVDGESRTLPCPGPGYLDTPTVIGGYEKSWYRGLIRNLRIQHGVTQTPERTASRDGNQP